MEISHYHNKTIVKKEFKDLYVNLVLTTKCNANCDFCYERHNDDVMSKKTIKKAIDFFYETKPNQINFWLFGGEPTITPEQTVYAIEVILENYKKSDIKTYVGLFTNGLTVNKEILDSLLSATFEGINTRIQVSYEGSCNNKRDKNNMVLRENIKENIKNYVKAGIVTQVRSTLSSDNFFDVEGMFNTFAWIIESGVSDYTIMPVIESVWDDESIKRWDSLFGKIKAYMKINRPTTFSNFDLRHKFVKNTPGCGAGNNFFSVDLNGDVFICHKVGSYSTMYQDKYKIGSIYTDINIIEKRPALSKCVECKISNCSQCFITNYFMLNDEEKIPETGYCEVRNVIWGHYLDYCKYLVDNNLMLKLNEDEETVISSLLLMGAFVDLTFPDIYVSYSDYRILVYSMSNDIVTKIANNLELEKFLPLSLASGAEFEDNLGKIFLFIEESLLYKYNEKYNAKLVIGSYVYTERIIRILDLLEILYGK